ncbi:MAG: DUF3037 domain-containing protein [Proteobacteria bacterium]|nr:MAG: DUF3037 domain-containing protein [Pseudomonadota bacterium]
MQPLITYDYAVIRLVPRVDRGEFINVGVILSSSATGFLKTKIHVNEARVLAFDPKADLESMRATLNAIPLICEGGNHAGDLGKLPLRERFHWLTAPRSSSVQTSPVHSGRCRDLQLALDDVFAKMVL